jgi:[protein-PII] uridylyltransferase
MPRRYLTAHAPRQIARHARVLLGLGPQRQLNTAVREMRGGFSELIVATRDTHGLFSKVAGVLTACGINILGAHVYSTRTGLALEVYRLTTPMGGDAERALAWEGFRKALDRVLSGEVEVAELLRRRGRPLRRDAPTSHRPESVEIENEESDFYTIIDVVANDRLGLLHDLTRTIAEQGYEIYISKVATILDQVTDTFYVKDPDGRKIDDPAAVERLRSDLLRAARGDEAAAVA